MMLANMPQHRHAIDQGQPQIQNHAIEARGIHHMHRHRAIAGHRDRVPHLGELRRQSVAQQIVVFNQE